MTLEFITLERNERIATITIDSPKTLNALSHQILTELEQVVEALKDDHEIDIVIVTGGGEKAFVAGANVKELSQLTKEEATEASKFGNNIFSKLANLPQPVIAAVNGYALGGGFELALACDLRFASENAVFGLPEVGLGIMPGYGGTQRLQRLTSPAYAKELAFTSRHVKADEALQKGLVAEVVPQEDLMQAVETFAQKILRQGPLAVKQTKRVINEGAELTLEEALDLESEAFGALFDSSDQKEGTNAFIEKRKPDFKGE